MNLIELSQQLLRASKKSGSINPLLSRLENFSITQLEMELENDAKRKAFWINIYNSFAIIHLKPNPSIILHPIKRKHFFNSKRIRISTCIFSLNDIEHQILRKSKIWWSKGYLSQPFIKPCFKKLRVNTFDERIHFALNCGGLGCPPIRFYDDEAIDQQLDTATQAFLYSETSKNRTQIKISKLFNWYIGDFGGTKGIMSFLKKYNVLNEKENLKIVYSDYNWEPWIK